MPATALESLDVIWLTAGLSCDGDTVSITAATQPSIEDLILGALPGVPKLRLHNPVLAYANGDDFMQTLYDAADGQSRVLGGGFIASAVAAAQMLPTRDVRVASGA